MSNSRIVRLRAYGVRPQPSPGSQRGGVANCAVDLLRLSLADGSEGAACRLVGAPGRLVPEIAAFAGRVVGADAACRVSLTGMLLGRHEGDDPPEAESMVDIAMWDAWGRHLAVPLWQMLGGFRERVPAYASIPAHDSIEGYLDDTRRALALGYRGVKLRMNGDPAFDLETVETVCAAFAGSGLRFMADVGGRYGHDDAVHLCSLLATLPFEWIEAPFDDHDLDAYVALNEAVAIDVLPAGNGLTGLDAWARGLRRGAWSRLRCEAGNAGGITTVVQGIALAQALGMTAEVRSWGFPATQCANLNIMLGVPGCGWFESPVPAQEFAYGVKDPLGLDAEGRVSASLSGGLGLEMDWDRIEADALVVFDSAD